PHGDCPGAGRAVSGAAGMTMSTIEEPQVNEPAATEFIAVADAESALALRERPGVTLLYLHDPWCPISSRAKRQLETLGGTIAMIDVDAHPDLTPTIEAITGIRHESPQAIVLRDGKPVWSGSLFAITTDAIRRALAQAEAA
ncbi:MAG TPA: monothiol bacilliredoxin BrxC family protein, partial [Thermomicrobiales bacterium]|nr:monothiol bacilliredoxin BrxC family protein [Thermomicrobiales bacterium]